MTRTSLLITLAAAAALAGCDNSAQNIVAGPDTGGPNSAANVTLPPSIAASKIYRCSGDNSVVYIDWLSDNKTANVRTEQGGAPTQVVAPEPGQPMTEAGGLSLTGTAAASSVSVTLPGQRPKTCHV